MKLPRVVSRDISDLRRKIAALSAELARIEGKTRINCPQIAAIADRVADETGVPTSLIFGASRRKQEAHARQRVYFLAREAGFSLLHIARVMGRDHATVHHGIRAEAERRAQ